MPELPEVEILRRELDEVLPGQKIKKLEVREAKIWRGPKNIEGLEVKKIERKGKVMIWRLSGGRAILIHLRMTGQLIYEGKERIGGGHPTKSMVGGLPDKHTRVILTFERGVLYFNDQRKFGFMQNVSDKQLAEYPFFKKLGPDPWEMDPEELLAKFKNRKAAVKALLLDQSIIAGIGNIYADEALYYARISPLRKAGSLNKVEIKRILEGARTAMSKSLEVGGSSLKNYVRTDGSRGGYLDLFAAMYGRDGEKCKRCGNIITKIRVAGRGTHYCKGCQK